MSRRQWFGTLTLIVAGCDGQVTIIKPAVVLSETGRGTLGSNVPKLPTTRSMLCDGEKVKSGVAVHTDSR